MTAAARARTLLYKLSGDKMRGPGKAKRARVESAMHLWGLIGQTEIGVVKEIMRLYGVSERTAERDFVDACDRLAREPINKDELSARMYRTRERGVRRLMQERDKAPPRTDTAGIDRQIDLELTAISRGTGIDAPNKTEHIIDVRAEVRAIWEAATDEERDIMRALAARADASRN